MAYTKTSFICLLLMIYMGYFHFSKNQLPLKRTFYFNFYFLSAIIVTLFDYITSTHGTFGITEFLNLQTYK